MNTTKMLGAVAVLGLLAGPALAQSTSGPGKSDTATNTATPATDKSAASNNDTYKVTTDGYLRTSKLVGADVYNSADTSIGTVDDLLVGAGAKTATAVISVGGFLGIDTKLVEVPFSKLKIAKNGHLTLAGATKASLTKLPGYAYNK